MPFARLRVDEVRGERARVAAEERVRERAVAPEEAGEVQPDQQLAERVEQARAQIGDPVACVPREERAVRKREVEMAGDEDVLEVLAARRDDADRLDDGDRLRRHVP
jgi:hypothetical protein